MERNKMIDKVCEKMCEYYCDDDTCSLNCLLCHNDKYCSRRQSAKELIDELFPEGSVILKGIDEGTMYAKVTEESVILTKDEIAMHNARLAELEDKIKRGLLVERPCKVGDKFYEVIPGLPPREWIVDEFVEGKESVVIFGRLSTGKCGYWKFWIDDFGNKLFTTKEAAEAKLEELGRK